MKGLQGLIERAWTAACPAVARFTSEKTGSEMGFDCNLNLEQTRGLWLGIQKILLCCNCLAFPKCVWAKEFYRFLRSMGLRGAEGGSWGKNYEELYSVLSNCVAL